MRLPVIGDTVHFRQNGRCYAATVVVVWGPFCVNLFVPPTGSDEPMPGALSAQRNAMSVGYDNDLHGRDWSWHWPPDARQNGWSPDAPPSTSATPESPKHAYETKG